MSGTDTWVESSIVAREYLVVVDVVEVVYVANVEDDVVRVLAVGVVYKYKVQSSDPSWIIS